MEEYVKGKIYTCTKCGKTFSFKEKKPWKKRVTNGSGFELCGTCISSMKNTKDTGVDYDADYTCKKCGDIYKLNKRNYAYRTTNGTTLDLCSSCIQAETQLNRFKNMTEEERAEYKLQKSKEWSKESKEAAKQRGIERYEKLSDKEKEEYAKIRVDYAKNMDEVKRKEWIDNINKSWTDERRQEHSEITSITNKKRWENATEEDKKAHGDKISKSLKAYFDNIPQDDQLKKIENKKYWWDNMTKEEFHKWSYSHSNGIANSIITKGPTEIHFANDLTIYGINYIWGYVNEIVHNDFDKLFPYNPILNTDRVGAHHAWDFKIDTLSKSILVDIDGREHVLEFKRKAPNGQYIEMKQLHEFNDSQRPYQTDGLDAYIIMAYSDVIDGDTPVLSISNNSYMKYDDFVNMLRYLNIKHNK